METLDQRLVLSADLMLTDSPWQNPANPVDVNNDGDFSPIDLLLVMNHIQSHADGSVTEGENGAPSFPDVNGDWNVTPIDALLQINYFNAVESGLPNLGLSASSMFGSPSSSASSSSGAGSNYATTMTTSGGPPAPSCPLDYLPPAITVWFRDGTGEVIDHVVEGQGFLLDTRVLESLPCPSGMVGDRVGWDIDWGDGTITSTNGTGPTVGGFQAAFVHVYLDDNPTKAPLDIYHITVTGSDKDGTGVLPVTFPVHNVAPTVTITSITPIDSVSEDDGGVNGRLDETEGFKVEGTVTDPGVLDTHTTTIEIDLNWDRDVADAGETVVVPLTLVSPGSYKFQHTVAQVRDDGEWTDSAGNPIWNNERKVDPLWVFVNDEDDDTESDIKFTIPAVHNIAPAFQPAEPSIEYEFSTDGVYLLKAKVTGGLVDIGAEDFHKIEIVWGDGQKSTVVLDPGVSAYSVTRDFGLPGQSDFESLFPIKVTLSDDDTDQVSVTKNFSCSDLDATAITINGVQYVGGRGAFYDVELFDPEVEGNLESTLLARWQANVAAFVGKGVCEIGFLQTVKAESDFAGPFGLMRESMLNHVWIVDTTVPYPFAIQPSPGLPPQPPNTTNPLGAPSQISMGDTPGAPITAWLFGAQVAPAVHLKMDFETCVVALQGHEGIRTEEHVVGFNDPLIPRLEAMAVYGCITWGHEFTADGNGGYDETRYLNGTLILGNDSLWSGAGFAPSDDFVRAVTQYFGYDIAPGGP